MIGRAKPRGGLQSNRSSARRPPQDFFTFFQRLGFPRPHSLVWAAVQAFLETSGSGNSSDTLLLHSTYRALLPYLLHAIHLAVSMCILMGMLTVHTHTESLDRLY